MENEYPFDNNLMSQIYALYAYVENVCVCVRNFQHIIQCFMKIKKVNFSPISMNKVKVKLKVKFTIKKHKTYMHIIYHSFKNL